MKITTSSLIILRKCDLPETFNVCNIIRELGGIVQHVYGTRIIIADIVDRIKDEIIAKLKPFGIFRKFVDTITNIPADLTQTEKLGLAGWNLRKTKSFIDELLSSSLRNKSWLDLGMNCCDNLETSANETDPLSSENRVMSQFLIGDIAVAMVFVNGPVADNLHFTLEEKKIISAHVQQGLDWLGKVESKAQVQWVYRTFDVSLNLPWVDLPNKFSDRENYWLPSAVNNLRETYRFSKSDLIGIVSEVCHDLTTNWGYIAFFCKYPFSSKALHAYALPPRVVFNCQNVSFTDLYLKFAHETCHVFGCPDEHLSEKDCKKGYGILEEINGNNIKCAVNQEKCLMNALTLELCNHSRVQLGWRDKDNDGLLDPIDPNPLMVNPFFDWRRLKNRFPELAKEIHVLNVANNATSHESVPLFLLRRVLDKKDFTKVKRLLDHQEDRFAGAILNKFKPK